MLTSTGRKVYFPQMNGRWDASLIGNMRCRERNGKTSKFIAPPTREPLILIDSLTSRKRLENEKEQNGMRSVSRDHTTRSLTSRRHRTITVAHWATQIGGTAVHQSFRRWWGPEKTRPTAKRSRAEFLWWWHDSAEGNTGPRPQKCSV